MTSRILPPQEWAKVADLDVSQMLPFVEPDNLQIAVVEDGDRIVACWAVVRMVHLEGVWIDPAYRHRPSVTKGLLQSALGAARAWTSKVVMTGAADDYVRRLITKHLGGVLVPSDHYVIPISGDQACRYSH